MPQDLQSLVEVKGFPAQHDFIPKCVGLRSPVATEETSSAATEDISFAATEMMYSSTIVQQMALGSGADSVS